MQDIIVLLFGEGKELNGLQMGSRAFVMFFITLLIIRISGMRSFGSKSAFDSIIVIMLGAVLSRAIAGASPFFPTVVAGLVLALVHRLLAIASMYSETLSHLLKSKELSVFKNGTIHRQNMKKACITKGDMIEGVRLQANLADLDEVQEIVMERTGEISVIKKK